MIHTLKSNSGASIVEMLIGLMIGLVALSAAYFGINLAHELFAKAMKDKELEALKGYLMENIDCDATFFDELANICPITLPPNNTNILLYKRRGIDVKPITAPLITGPIKNRTDLEGSGRFGSYFIKAICDVNSIVIRVADMRYDSDEDKLYFRELPNSRENDPSKINQPPEYSKKILMDFEAPYNPLIAARDGLCSHKFNVKVVETASTVYKTIIPVTNTLDSTSATSVNLISTNYTPEGEVLRFNYNTNYMTGNSYEPPASDTNEGVLLEIFLSISQEGSTVLNEKILHFDGTKGSLGHELNIDRVVSGLTPGSPVSIDIQANTSNTLANTTWKTVRVYSGLITIEDYK